MSIQTDIVTALAVVAGGRVYPEAAPQDALEPLVIYRRTVYAPVMTLQGYSGTANSKFMFECWAMTKAESLALANDVIAAIEISSIPNKYREQVSGELFEPGTTEVMEPVQYSFWHA